MTRSNRTPKQIALPLGNNPSGLCACGCGKATKLHKMNRYDRGAVRGLPQKRIAGHYTQPPPEMNPNPSGLCGCGCGEMTLIAARTNSKYGWVKGYPRSFVAGHKLRVPIGEVEPPNPSGLCLCGCGQLTGIAPATKRSSGDVRGHPRRFIHSHGSYKDTPRWVVDDETGCWEWQWFRLPSGYGQATINGRSVPAHRAVYEEVQGPIPEGLHLHHVCRNRACVNPAHLQPLTQPENNRLKDGVKLTAEQVPEIRRLAQTHADCLSLAEEYGVSVSTIEGIRMGRTWKGVH